MLLQLHLLLLELHLLLADIVVALMYLVYLTDVMIIGQHAERIVVYVAKAAMMSVSVVAVMWRILRELICNGNSKARFKIVLIKVNVAAAGAALNDKLKIIA